MLAKQLPSISIISIRTNWNFTPHKSCTFSPIYLFSCGLVLVWACGYLAYSRHYNPLLALYILLLNLSQTQSLGEPSSWLPFWHDPIIFGSPSYFLEPQNVPGWSCAFPGPALVSAAPPGSPVPSQWGMWLRSQDLDTRGAHCSLAVTAFRLSHLSCRFICFSVPFWIPLICCVWVKVR